MTRKTSVLPVIAGLTMLALPVSALAGHHYDQDDDPRPYAWHNHGWHRGWFKHHPRYGVRPIEDEDDEGYHFKSAERAPAFLCDSDGDDCEPNQGARDDNDYGPISYYRAAPPAGYNLVQQRNWLLAHRRRAYHVLGLMQARHDSRAVQRISTVIRGLDARIARDNQLLVGERYPSPPVSYYPSEPNPNYNYSGQSNSYFGNYGYNPSYGYNPGYGYSPNAPASPSLNALASMVGPLLGFPSH